MNVSIGGLNFSGHCLTRLTITSLLARNLQNALKNPKMVFLVTPPPIFFSSNLIQKVETFLSPYCRHLHFNLRLAGGVSPLNIGK